jgi:hypothetical protein
VNVTECNSVAYDAAAAMVPGKSTATRVAVAVVLERIHVAVAVVLERTRAVVAAVLEKLENFFDTICVLVTMSFFTSV